MKHKLSSITRTLRFRILFPLMIIILLVTLVEIYYLNQYAFDIVEEIVLDTKSKNARQVLNSVERFFDNIQTIAKKPLNTIEISSRLRKDYSNLSVAEKSSDEYYIQMFLFREIMLPNPEIESALIYNTSQDIYYGISDTYTLYKDSYYHFTQHSTDFDSLLASDGAPFISGIRESYMMVQPHEDNVITYANAFNNHFKSENAIYGAFYINLKASAFADLCSKNFVEDTGTCYLLDQNNRIVFCENPAMISQSITDFFSVSSQLDSPDNSNISDDNYLYTATAVSDSCGWRVMTISETSDVFGYKQIIFRMILIGMLLLMLVIFLIVWLIISNFIKPITVMKQKLLLVSAGNLQVKFEGSPSEIGEVNDMIQHMLDEINRLISCIYQEENAKRELQLHSLQNQITPHFIYNTLSRLKWMASMQQANTLANALGSFSDILSYCMQSTDYFIALGEEIAFLKHYIQIMNLRMLNEVHVVYQIPENLLSVKILRFLLQPVIENVFFHAFTGVEHECILSITAASDGTNLTFFIQDNGIGIDAKQMETLFLENDASAASDHSSIALKNVQQRIHYHYGTEYGISASSVSGEGTLITISLPCEEFSPD